jgi:hypothetical protein
MRFRVNCSRVAEIWGIWRWITAQRRRAVAGQFEDHPLSRRDTRRAIRRSPGEPGLAYWIGFADGWQAGVIGVGSSIINRRDENVTQPGSPGDLHPWPGACRAGDNWILLAMVAGWRNGVVSSATTTRQNVTQPGSPGDLHLGPARAAPWTIGQRHKAERRRASSRLFDPRVDPQRLIQFIRAVRQHRQHDLHLLARQRQRSRSTCSGPSP